MIISFQLDNSPKEWPRGDVLYSYMRSEIFHNGFSDDEPDRQWQDSFSGEVRLSQRYDDIANLLADRSRLLLHQVEDGLKEKDVLSTPSTWRPYTYIPRDPFRRRSMELQALKELGYGVHCADDAPVPVPRGESRSGFLGVYVDEADMPAIRMITELTTAVAQLPDLDRPPLFREFLYLLEEEGGVHAHQLIQASPDAPPEIGAYLTPAEEALVPYARERGFMTSRLLYGINGWLRHNNPDHYDTQEDRKLYDELRWAGYKPFTGRELFNLGSFAIAHVVLSTAGNNIPPPAGRTGGQE
jgi:hypothetical protein